MDVEQPKLPLVTWYLGHLADAAVPFSDLSQAGEKSLTLVPFKQRDAWRYGAISLGLFLMGGWALNNAGQYNHLPQELPAWAVALQCVAVVAAFVAGAVAFHSIPTHRLRPHLPGMRAHHRPVHPAGVPA